MYKKYFKRLIDFSLALLGIIITSPIFFVVFILLGLSNKGRPFFIQKRPGKDEKIFSIIKFKTMNDNKDENGNLLQDSKRLTIVGEVIRKTSIDELPQLLNILKGDMSLIGPRPLLVDYLPLYSVFHKRRHEVMPGITGWAQVNGRQSLMLSERRNFDIWYVDNLSFSLDLKIFVKTIVNVLSSKDIKSGQDMSVVDDLGFSKHLKK